MAGCPTCGGRRTMTPPRMQAGRQAPRMRGPAAGDQDTVLIEFIGNGTRTISGYATQSTYRFGDDPEHKRRRMYRQDYERIQNRPDFQLVEEPKAEKAPAVDKDVELKPSRRGRRQQAAGDDEPVATSEADDEDRQRPGREEDETQPVETAETVDTQPGTEPASS